MTKKELEAELHRLRKCIFTMGMQSTTITNVTFAPYQARETLGVVVCTARVTINDCLVLNLRLCRGEREPYYVGYPSDSTMDSMCYFITPLSKNLKDEIERVVISKYLEHLGK